LQSKSKESVLADIRRAAADVELARVRAELAGFSAQTFHDVGRLLHLSGLMIGPDRVAGVSPFQNGSDETYGVALLFRITHQLIMGISVLFDSRQCYAGAALLRQLVEVEYLAWAFKTRDRDAERWLRSSKSERETFFSPRKIRAAANGKFRGQDYGYHCELGGHPTPLARSLLDDDGTMSQVLLTDLLHHVQQIWIHLMGWVENVHKDDYITERNNAMLEKYMHWARVDPLHSLPPSP
jgi:hypothetical protein